jgi:hypothetical protein
MPITEDENRLRSARSLLDRFMCEGDAPRADSVNLSVQMDEALPPLAEVSVSSVSPEEMTNVPA